jgi:hypothetical protein
VDLANEATGALVRAVMDGCDGDRLYERLAEELDPEDVPGAAGAKIGERCARLRRSALAPVLVWSS